MSANEPVIQIDDLHCRYGRTEALNGLTLTVERGRCHGLFGRNGAGKTTAIKCMMNLLQPASGVVELFGLDPGRHEVDVKKRLCFVPDQVGFYSWMRIGDYFQYLASYRDHWNPDLERELADRFELDRRQKCLALSRGQQVQVALIGAVCPEPELLILDEPTSGLDPLVRREFIRAVIGAYQDGDPECRTVFVSTHLITEFEGLIDRFTVIEKGRQVSTMDTEEARATYRRIRARFAEAPPSIDTRGAISTEVVGREISILVNGSADAMLATVDAHQPVQVEVEALGLEDIFLASLRGARE